MIRHTQLFRHDPDNGVYGDCHRTALACLFDIASPADVPHFMVDNPSTKVFYEREAAWLLEQGFRSYHFPVQCDNLSAALEYIETFAPGVYCILGGASARGTAHSVIVCGGKLEHDPHPDGGFITGPLDGHFWIQLFIPVRFWRGAE